VGTSVADIRTRAQAAAEELFERRRKVLAKEDLPTEPTPPHLQPSA
jgi:hypothetical protein